MARSSGAVITGFDVYVQKKKGIRFAYLEALPLITGDVVLTLSPDGNCPVEFIPAILRRSNEGYNLVIGSRYLGTCEERRRRPSDWIW